MRAGKIFILLCLLLIVSAGEAPAEFKGLLLLGDVRQSVVLTYGYSGQVIIPKGSDSSSSSQNSFSETYNAGVEYSILHPYILNGHAKAGLGLDQQMYSSRTSSSSGAGNRYSYDIDGAIFKISPTPGNFSVRSETLHISAPFTPGYDVTTDSYAVGASFRNKILGLRVDHQHTTSETSGTTSDSRQKIGLLALKVDNIYKNSATDVQINHVTSSLEPLSSVGTGITKNTSYSILGRNTLSSSRKDKTLSSSVSYREEKQIGITKTLTLGESFSWQLGKALNVSLSYENGSVSTSRIPGGAATETTQQIGTASLTHLLYKSLSSSLKLQGRQNDRDVGRETEYAASAHFFYTKKLSATDSLTLNYSEGYSVIDRRLTSGGLTIIDEPLTAQLTGDILLQQPNVVSSSIIVRDQTNPLIIYDDRDYRIIQNGPFTGFDFFVIGSRITEGKRVLVTYQYNVDASVNYRRYAHGGGGAITFEEGTYQLYANMSQSSQETTSGQEGILRSGRSLDYSLGATRNKNDTYANILYVSSDSDQVKNQSLEVTFRNTQYFDGSSFNTQAKDRQTWYGVTSYNSAAHTQNQLSLSADYARNVFSNGVVTLRAIYFRVVDTNRTRNDVMFESIYRWGIGNLFLEASGKVHFLDNDGNRALDNQIHLRGTRTF